MILELLVIFWLLPALVVALFLIWTANEPMEDWNRVSTCAWVGLSVFYFVGLVLVLKVVLTPRRCDWPKPSNIWGMLTKSR